MINIRSFPTYLATPSGATRVVAPPYDSMTPEERSAFGTTHPENFINAIRSIEQFHDGNELSLNELLRRNVETLEKSLKSDAFSFQSQPMIFIYQLSHEDHTQTGIVAEVPLSDYRSGLILGHENTRAEHEERLYQYLKVVGAVSSPICAAYSGNSVIDDIVANVTSGPEWIELEDDCHVVQKIWRIMDQRVQRSLVSLFREIPVMYLTDGHHRVAAGVRYADQKSGESTGDEPWHHLLMAIFPIDQMRILSFNRCIRDMGNLSASDLLTDLSKVFSVKKCQPSALDFYGPRRRREFVLLMDHEYYRLTISPERVSNHPVDSLDVSLLQDLVLAPLLGIFNPRSDSRLGYVAGESGLTGLQDRCREGWRLCFACYPTSFDELMAVADAGLRMPPKSTCFDPKARSGIFVRRF